MTSRRPGPSSWSGLVATIVALAVGGSFTVAMIGVTVQNDPVSTAGAALLNTIGGGLVAVLSLWIGGQTEAANKDRETRGETMTTTPDEPRDPATDPNRDLRVTPQDGELGEGQPVAEPDEDDGETPKSPTK